MLLWLQLISFFALAISSKSLIKLDTSDWFFLEVYTRSLGTKTFQFAGFLENDGGDLRLTMNTALKTPFQLSNTEINFAGKLKDTFGTDPSGRLRMETDTLETKKHHFVPMAKVHWIKSTLRLQPNEAPIVSVLPVDGSFFGCAHGVSSGMNFWLKHATHPVGCDRLILFRLKDYQE